MVMYLHCSPSRFKSFCSDINVTYLTIMRFKRHVPPNLRLYILDTTLGEFTSKNRTNYVRLKIGSNIYWEMREEDNKTNVEMWNTIHKDCI
jgi:hypothetical protein